MEQVDYSYQAIQWANRAAEKDLSEFRETISEMKSTSAKNEAAIERKDLNNK